MHEDQNPEKKADVENIDTKVPTGEGEMTEERASVLSDQVVRSDKVHDGRRKRTLTWILSGIVVVGVILGVILLTMPKDPEPEIKSRLLYEYSTNLLDKVTVTNAHGSYTLAWDKTLMRYVLADQPEARLNQSSANSVFTNISGPVVEETLTVGADGLTPYGLDNPVATVEAPYSDGKVVKMYIGARTPAGTSYYMRIDGDDHVYVIWSNVATTFTNSARSLRSLELPKLDSEKIASVRLEVDGEVVLDMTSEAHPTDMSTSRLRMIYPYDQLVSVSAVKALTDRTLGLSLYEYMDTPQDFAPYGLDEPKLAIQMKDQNGMAFELFIGNEIPDTQYSYVRVGGYDDVFSIQTSTVAYVRTTNPFSLVEGFTSLIDLGRVTHVVAKTQKGQVELHLERYKEFEDDEEVITYTINGQEVEATELRGLYHKLINVQVQNLVTGSVDDYAVLALEFTLTNGERTQIEYLEYDMDHYALRRNGEAKFYVRKTNVDEAVAALNNYL